MHKQGKLLEFVANQERSSWHLKRESSFGWLEALLHLRCSCRAEVDEAKKWGASEGELLPSGAGSEPA